MQRSYFYTEFQDTYQVEESMSKTSAEAEKNKNHSFYDLCISRIPFKYPIAYNRPNAV